MSGHAPLVDRRERDKPESLRGRRISVSLTVADLQASLKWYCDVVGFTVRESWENHGAVVGVEMVAGSVRIVLNQDDWSKGRDRVKGQGISLYLSTVQDVDGIASHIKDRGGALASEPADMPWGTRSFSIVDPDGFRWTISSLQE